MATMATDMLLKNKLIYTTILFMSNIISVSAGDWTFSPALTLNETYSNNINSNAVNKESSLITEASASIQTGYESKQATLLFLGQHNYYTYSHDDEINDSTQSLQASGSIKLTDNFSLTSSFEIDNITQNTANNSLETLVIQDTVESKNHQLGAQYNVTNSTLSLNSSINYQTTRVEDNIGDSEGYTINFSSQNGSNARNVFWSSNGSYSDRKNGDSTGRNYDYEIKVGWISPYRITPFIRYYNEDSSGSISSSNNTNTNSWGPGLRWKIAKHLFLDTSYNYVGDSSESDDYIDAEINWQPSSLTTLNASYSERFFGKSYSGEFTHRNKRLSNTISYKESLTIFSRDNYELNNTGDLILVEDNEFSLTKTLSWQSSLSLKRTTFTTAFSQTERDSLESNNKYESLTGQFSLSRQTSAKSSLSFSFNYVGTIFNRNSTTGSEQTDYYRTYSMGYNRNLLRSLSSSINIQYINRSSSTDSLSYDEARATLNISKEF